MKKIISVIALLVFLTNYIAAQISATPLPSKQQLAWHDMEFYLFAHFGPNTFTDLEWGHGNENEEVFNPTDFDAEQWCRIAKQAGAKGIIITAKHHDGFCLWPSKYSKHTVRESKWKNGKGDVVKEVSLACKKYGLKFGVYISPWDRNHPDYGTEKYNDVFVNMMKELFTNYGPIWELWWDGANGEGPNGKKQVYDWSRFRAIVKKLSPNTVIFSDVGPHIRWVGNEKGIAGETNWNYLDTTGFTAGAGAPAQEVLNTGNRNGEAWIPAECDVSIRPGWFYHKEEDAKVKTPEQLYELYLKSVGRGANFLLNVPPDRRGLIYSTDSAAMVGFRKLREENFKNNLAKNGTAFFGPHSTNRPATVLNDGKTNGYVSIDIPNLQSVGIAFEKPTTVNCIVLKENLVNGQQCAAFKVLLMDENQEIEREIKGTTIGRKRILTFPETTTNRISLIIDDQKAPTQISEMELYKIDANLIEKK